MSRKERYICEVNKSFDIFDNLYKEYSSMQEICRTLNKQYYRIAELEEQLKEKEKYTYTGKEVGEIERKYDEKIDTLEQQLKSQPAEIVEKIREFCLTDHKFKECEIYLREDNGQTIYSFLDDILKEYQK